MRRSLWTVGVAVMTVSAARRHRRSMGPPARVRRPTAIRRTRTVCSSRPGMPWPGGTRRWPRPAARRARAFMPVGELTGQVGDWEQEVGDNNKIALMTGEVDPRVVGGRGAGVGRGALGGRRHQYGRGDHRGGGIAAARRRRQPRLRRLPAAAGDRGEPRHGAGPDESGAGDRADLGVHRRGDLRAVHPGGGRPDKSVTVTPPPWDAYNAPVGLWISSAEVSADGRQTHRDVRRLAPAGHRPVRHRLHRPGGRVGQRGRGDHRRAPVRRGRLHLQRHGGDAHRDCRPRHAAR